MNSSLVETSGIFLQKPAAAKIKIGYVSSDLCNHPVGHLMLSGKISTLLLFFKFLIIFIVFGLHDREKFEVNCYSLTPSDGSKWRSKIEADVDSFKDISQVILS